MAYDEGLAQRIREVLEARRGIVEKRMFGGLAFLLQGHMVIGVVSDNLMCRVGPAAYDRALARPQARPMDFTGKPLKGFVFVAPGGFTDDRDLEEWIGDCLEFVETLPPKTASR